MEIKSKYSFPKITNKDDVVILELVKAFINHVEENIYDVVDDPWSFLYVPKAKEHIDHVLNELKLLHTFICFVSGRFMEPLTQYHVSFFAHALGVASHASVLSWLYLPNLAPEEIHILLSDFLRMRIKPIQKCIRKLYFDFFQALKSTLQSGCYPKIQNEHSADIEATCVKVILHNLVKLHMNCNSCQRVSLNHHLAIFEEMINFLRDKIKFRMPIQYLESFLRDINTMVIDVGLVVYSEHMELGEVVLPLLENFNQRISTTLYLAIRKVFQSNLPRIHGLGYVDFVLSNLKEFQSRHSNALASVTNQLQIIHKELERVHPYLVAVAEHLHNADKIQDCVTQLISIAHEVEYIVDACTRKEAPVCCLEQWLVDITEEIPLIIDEVAKIQEKKIVNAFTPHKSSYLMPRMKEEFVGFKDVIEELREKLTKGTKGRAVISIVGMPGLGKTTLAYKLYSDSSVVSHFDIRAQCCVSQVYSRKDLLLALLHDAIGEDTLHRTKEADQIADELRKALFSKRYLILVDDVWETSVWDDLIGCFQDVNNGSRIILTTRKHDVANYAKFEFDPLLLRMFNDDESWDLLRKKVFVDETCFPNLTNIGKRIAKSCGQLPLSISLVAGILAGIEKNEECWEHVVDNLGTYIQNDSREIIEKSYQNLPYHLRSCFLYFGAFGEDNEISVSKLIKLWISEGFIKSCQGKSLEDIAEGYLQNLVGRNLVMGTNKSYGGKIEACQIHDLLHDFCRERAKQEIFLLCVNRDENEQLAYRMSNCYPDVTWHLCQPHVSSIILCDCPATDFLHGFKFLKVMDLERTRIPSFPTGLLYLRYFAAKTLASPIPSSLASSNWNLETIIVHHYPAKKLPITLCEMVKLRHLHVYIGRFTIENEEELLNNPKSLCNLTTLSYPRFSCVRDLELLLRKTPNLRELRCEVVPGTADDFHYYLLYFPTWIETLEFSFQGFIPTVFPFCISAPNLENLTLWDFLLHPRHLSEIASLQNLQVLKLNSIQFESKEWEVTNVEFPQLKVLELIKHLFVEWNVADDAFPNLEHLLLQDCIYLKEIPSCFQDMCSLKSIVVLYCNEFVNKSATDIWKTQVEDYQSSVFMLFIDGKKYYASH